MPLLSSTRGKGLYIDKEKCKGCGLCIEMCPVEVLEFSNELNSRGIFPVTLKPGGRCTMCTQCEYICPDFALYILPL